MRNLSILCLISLFAVSLSSEAALTRYGASLCKSNDDYKCVQVKNKQSWESMFKDAYQRDLVKRVNRMNVRLRPGMIIAVPHDLSGATLMQLAPFEHYIEPLGEPVLIFDPSKKAWAAYNEYGHLIKWGAASGGKSYCPDTKSKCRTVVGSFRMYRKQGEACKSRKFPIGKGGAPMPYCMFFHGGFAFHGSPIVPGYHASHGCVRLFKEDARWLNREFVKLSSSSDRGTKVIVKSY